MNGFIGSMTFIHEGNYFIYFLTKDDTTPKYRLAKDLDSLLFKKEGSLPHSYSNPRINGCQENHDF